MIWVRQPPIAVGVRPELSPIGGINPGGFGFNDTIGTTLVLGSGITKTLIPQGMAADGTSTNTGFTRATAFTDHPFTFVAVVSPDTTASNMCIGSIATTADKTCRVFTNSTGGLFAQHIGATTNASATCSQVFTFGGWLYVVAVFASPTDVRIYARGDFASAVPVQTVTNVGALGALNKLCFGTYDGSVKATPFDGRIALAQWFRGAFNDTQASAILRNPWSIFTPIRTRTFFAPSIAYSYAYPTSDITTDSWLNESASTPLYPSLADSSTTTPNDATFIYSPDNPTTQEFEVKFGPLSNPGVTTDHIVSYRLQAIGLDTTFLMTFMCGATQIAQWTESVTVAAGLTTYNKTLSGAEASNITDYTDLRLRGKASV